MVDRTKERRFEFLQNTAVNRDDIVYVAVIKLRSAVTLRELSFEKYLYTYKVGEPQCHVEEDELI